MNNIEPKKQEHSGIISSVEKLVENAIKNKSFVPLDFNFPNFSIDKETHIKLVQQLVQRKVSVKMSLGQYNSQSLLNKGENFDDLLLNEINGNKNQRLADLAQKALMLDVIRDRDFSEMKMQSIARSAVMRGLTVHVKAVMLKVNTLKNGQGNAFDNELPLDAERQIDALAADLIYLKFKNQIAFRDIKAEIENSPFPEVKEQLLKEVEAPSQTTLHILNKFDSGFVKENFSREFMILSNNNDMANKIAKIRSFPKPEPKPNFLKRMFA